MGVKGLNSLIMNWCKLQIRPTNINTLFGKKIAIDTSIYMYEFKGRKSLLSDFNDMILMFRNNNITPIFVFDGKGPLEKNETLITRRENKRKAEDEYKVLLDKLLVLDNTNNSLSLEPERQRMISRLTILEDKFVRINKQDICNVKELMDLYGVIYYDHDGEAEQLCSKMVIDGSVYACMSDDMDLFIYGCPRILKRLDLRRNTLDYYDLGVILKSLNVTLRDFKHICVLSGTDYNKKGTSAHISIKTAFKLFSDYEYAVKRRKAAPNSFYYYISTARNAKINFKELFGIVEMFDLSDVKPPIINIACQYSIKNIEDDAGSREKLHGLLSL